MSRNRNDIFDEQFLARLQRLHLVAKRLASGRSAGQRRSLRLGDGLEFADHRDYAAGDDIRFIDWPYYARMEKLLLRLFHEHSEADVTVMLDTSASMACGPGKFDYALRVTAALAYVAMGALERVVVAPFAADCGQVFRTGRNRDQVLAVLDYLSGLEPGEKTDLAASADRLIRQHRPHGTVLLVSDLMEVGEQLADAMGRLKAAGCDAAVVHVYDDSDASPRLGGPMLLRQAETGQQLSLLVTPEIVESYRKQWGLFQHGCEQACAARGATYVAAPSSTPFDHLVLMTMRKAGLLE